MILIQEYLLIAVNFEDDYNLIEYHDRNSESMDILLRKTSKWELEFDFTSKLEKVELLCKIIQVKNRITNVY